MEFITGYEVLLPATASAQPAALESGREAMQGAADAEEEEQPTLFGGRGAAISGVVNGGGAAGETALGLVGSDRGSGG